MAVTDKIIPTAIKIATPSIHPWAKPSDIIPTIKEIKAAISKILRILSSS